jgi:hypothetical protein
MTTSADARDSYRPFIKDLQDIKSYLSTDLSKARVADINDAAIKLHSDGMDVKAKIDRVIKVLDSIEPPGTT